MLSLRVVQRLNKEYAKFVGLTSAANEFIVEGDEMSEGGTFGGAPAHSSSEWPYEQSGIVARPTID